MRSMIDRRCSESKYYSSPLLGASLRAWHNFRLALRRTCRILRDKSQRRTATESQSREESVLYYNFQNNWVAHEKENPADEK
jgi:hypothetical protein